MSFWTAKRVLVTGGAGFLGSHVVEKLSQRGIPVDAIVVPRRAIQDLRRWDVCLAVTAGVDIAIHVAGHVGGIGYNIAYPATLFYDNLMMGVQLMEAARQNGVQKFVTVGTGCAYPKHTPVPFRETELWNGYPEETNAPYAIAKIALLVGGQAYRQQYDLNAIYVIPVNLYGPRDNFDIEGSHVVPAFIRKSLEAKDKGDEHLVVWGDGSPRREFLYVEDAAEGIVLAAERYNRSDPVNLGSAFEISIKDLLGIITHLTGFEGKIVWDTTKPNGQPRRKLDASRAKRAFGFQAQTPFEDGLQRTIDWYINRQGLGS